MGRIHDELPGPKPGRAPLCLAAGLPSTFAGAVPGCGRDDLFPNGDLNPVEDPELDFSRGTSVVSTGAALASAVVIFASASRMGATEDF